jgi:hypothetical protein
VAGVIGRLLLRLGGLTVVGTCVYLAVWETWMGGADNALFLRLLGAGGAGMAAGVVLMILGRGAAGLAARQCRRCGRRVGRGRVYCDDHLKEAVNEFRDQERERRG